MTASQETQKAITNVHFTLQGKGGVGKSFISAILVQYLRSHGRSVQPVDTDLVNHTLAQYPDLGAQHLELMRDGTIDTRLFDGLMEKLLTNSGDFVIDNGASTFIPLWHYLIDNAVLPLLKTSGKKVYIHTVLTGGQALLDTLAGFQTLAETVEDRSIVVWINEFFGPVENDDNKHFLESQLYNETKDRIVGIVGIPRRNPDTYGRDIQELLAKKLTFKEARENGHFSIMAKQRIKQVQTELFDQLDKIKLA
jgi:hypothetical protein